MLTVNMTKAREIHRAKLREMRIPKLAALDIEFQRAMETGVDSNMKAVALKKQALRDVTNHPDIEAAQTIDDLKKVIPDCLK